MRAICTAVLLLGLTALAAPLFAADHTDAPFNSYVVDERTSRGYFVEVLGLGSESDVVEVRHADDRLVRKRPGKPRRNVVRLSRTYTGDDGFWAWRQRTLEAQGRDDVSITFEAGDGASVQVVLFDAWVRSYHLGHHVHHDGEAVVIETIELVHR